MCLISTYGEETIWSSGSSLQVPCHNTDLVRLSTSPLVARRALLPSPLLFRPMRLIGERRQHGSEPCEAAARLWIEKADKKRCPSFSIRLRLSSSLLPPPPPLLSLSLSSSLSYPRAQQTLSVASPHSFAHTPLLNRPSSSITMRFLSSLALVASALLVSAKDLVPSGGRSDVIPGSYIVQLKEGAVFGRRALVSCACCSSSS